jgi:hypothetical protein
VKKNFRITFLISFFVLTVLYTHRDVSIAQEADYVRDAVKSAIFVYPSNTQPCATANPEQPLTPAGSGFVVGLARKGGALGWKFLVTADHVIGNQSSVILRMNQKDTQAFICYPLTLVASGPNQNVFRSTRPEADIVAINIPDIPNTYPTVFDYSLLLDEKIINDWEIREGADVFTVGYLFGYAGIKQNFPVTKFGKVALLTDELWYRSNRSITITLTEQQREQVRKASGKVVTDVQIAPGILEKGYIVELQNVPGLSGAPVILQSLQLRITEKNVLQHRRLDPLILGVIKGLLPSPVGGSQGVAVIEPAPHLRELLRSIADHLNAAGFEVELQPSTTKKQ